MACLMNQPKRAVVGSPPTGCVAAIVGIARDRTGAAGILCDPHRDIKVYLVGSQPGPGVVLSVGLERPPRLWGVSWVNAKPLARTAGAALERSADLHNLSDAVPITA